MKHKLVLNRDLLFQSEDLVVFDGDQMRLNIAASVRETYCMKTVIDKFDELSCLSRLYRGIAAVQEFVDAQESTRLVFTFAGNSCFVSLGAHGLPGIHPLWRRR